MHLGIAIVIAVLVLALIIFLLGIFVVPQQQADVIERFGKYHRVALAGIQIGRASCRERV